MSAGVTLRFYRVGQGDEFVPGQGSGFLPNEGDELVPSGGDEFIPGSGDEFIPGSGDEFIPGSGDEFIPGSGDELVPSGGDEFIPGSGLPELDEVAARGLGRTVPYRVKTCNIGEQNCQSPPNPDPQFLIHRVHAAWDPPVVDPVSQYLVSRKRVDTNGTNYPWVDRPPTPSSTPAYDNTEHLPNGVQFTFRVRARFFDQALSGYSRLITTATITARNDAPVATNDSYTTERNRTLRISTRAAGVLGNDTDEDTPAALLKARVVTGSGPSSGTLTLNPEDGTFTYTPQNGFTGTVTFKYVAHNGTWSEDPTVSISPDSNEATVTITVTAK
jgi:hypothetical protein